MSNFGANIEHPARYAEAVHSRILGNARKTFFRTFERGQEVADYLLGFEESKNDFMRSMCENLHDKYGKLTQGQYDAVCRHIDGAAERRAKMDTAIAEQKARSAFLGVVAEKVKMFVTVEKVLTVEAMQFGYYDRATQEVYLMRDAEGNRVVYKTKSDFRWKPATKCQVKYRADMAQAGGLWIADCYVYQVREGDKLEIEATIKAHTEYKKEKQTLITRPKILGMEFKEEVTK